MHVVGFAQVTRVLIDEYKRAVGVTFDRFSLSHAVYATTEVILSAGTIGSAQLLMLSGVGPARHLARLGVSDTLTRNNSCFNELASLHNHTINVILVFLFLR